LGRLLRRCRVGAQPETEMRALFDPEPLGVGNVLVGVNAVVELHIGVVRPVNDQARAANPLKRKVAVLLVLLIVVVRAGSPQAVGLH
jgi:hypothetical protein